LIKEGKLGEWFYASVYKNRGYSYWR
jgi:hypothetical protein